MLAYSGQIPDHDALLPEVLTRGLPAVAKSCAASDPDACEQLRVFMGSNAVRYVTRAEAESYWAELETQCNQGVKSACEPPKHVAAKTHDVPVAEPEQQPFRIKWAKHAAAPAAQATKAKSAYERANLWQEAELADPASADTHDQAGAAMKAHRLETTTIMRKVMQDFAPQAKQCFENALKEDETLGATKVLLVLTVGKAQNIQAVSTEPLISALTPCLLARAKQLGNLPRLFDAQSFRQTFSFGLNR